MNSDFLELADRAGFVFWENESWKPKGAIIDWSCEYDKEFEKYSQLLVQYVLSHIETESRYLACNGHYLEAGVALGLYEKLIGEL